MSRPAVPPLTTRVVMGSAAPAQVEEPEPDPEAVVVEEKPPAPQLSQPDDLREAVLRSLDSGSNRMLISMLEAGEWRVDDNDLVIEKSSAAMIDMSVSADARRIMIATASGVLGRALKVRVVPGGRAQPAVTRAPAVGGRGRAEQDPIVKRMREKLAPRSERSSTTPSGVSRISFVKERHQEIPMSGFNMQELISQAKKQYESLQRKMEETQVEATSGGGSVTVKMDGRKQVLGSRSTQRR